MNMALDGSLNRHGGQAAMESNADERARERAEAVEERMLELLSRRVLRYQDHCVQCPECEEYVAVDDSGKLAHLATCELLRARAEAECDAAERGR